MIEHQILRSNLKSHVGQTVRRITSEISRVEGLNSTTKFILTLYVGLICFKISMSQDLSNVYNL